MSGDEVSELRADGCSAGGCEKEEGASALASVCRTDGVGDRVGNEEYVAEGEGKLEMLPCREGFFDLFALSYGLWRALPLALDIESFFLFEGALVSISGICAFNLSWVQSGVLGNPAKLATSSVVRVLAPVVLWSSVIMIGLDMPDPMSRPVWSVMVKWTLKPTFSR